MKLVKAVYCLFIRQQQELETLDKNHQQELELYLSEFHPELIQAVTETAGVGGQQGSTVWGPCPPCPPIKDALFPKTEIKRLEIGNLLPHTLPKKVPVKIISDPNDVAPLADTHIQPLTLPSLGAMEGRNDDISNMSPSLDYQDNRTDEVKEFSELPKDSSADDVTSTYLKRSQSLKDHLRQMNRMVSPSSAASLKRKQSIDMAILASKEFEGTAGEQEKLEVVSVAESGAARADRSEVLASAATSAALPAASSVALGVLLSDATGIQSQPRVSLAEKPSLSQQPRVSAVPIGRPTQPSMASFQSALVEQLHVLFPNFVPGRTPSAISHAQHLTDGAPNASKPPSQPMVAASVHLAVTQALGHQGSVPPHLMPQTSAILHGHASLRPSVLTSPVHALVQQQANSSSLPTSVYQQSTPQMAAMSGILQNIQHSIGPLSAAAAGVPSQPVSGVDGNMLGVTADPQSLATALYLIQQYSQNPEQLEMLLQQGPHHALMHQLAQQAPASKALPLHLPVSYHSVAATGPSQQLGLVQNPLSQNNPQQMLVQQTGQHLPKPGPESQVTPLSVPLPSAKAQISSSVIQSQMLPQSQLLAGQQQQQQPLVQQLMSQLIHQPGGLQGQTPQQTQMLLQYLFSDGAVTSNPGNPPVSSLPAQFPGSASHLMTASDGQVLTGAGSQLKLVQLPSSGPVGQVNLPHTDDAVVQQLLSQKAAIENYLTHHYPNQPITSLEHLDSVQTPNLVGQDIVQAAASAQLLDHAAEALRPIVAPLTGQPTAAYWGNQGQLPQPPISSLDLAGQQLVSGIPGGAMIQSGQAAHALRLPAGAPSLTEKSLGSQLYGNLQTQNQLRLLLDQMSANSGSQIVDEQMLYELQQQLEQQQQQQALSFMPVDHGQPAYGAFPVLGGTLPLQSVVPTPMMAPTRGAPVPLQAMRQVAPQRTQMLPQPAKVMPSAMVAAAPRVMSGQVGMAMDTQHRQMSAVETLPSSVVVTTLPSSHP